MKEHAVTYINMQNTKEGMHDGRTTGGGGGGGGVGWGEWESEGREEGEIWWKERKRGREGKREGGMQSHTDINMLHTVLYLHVHCTCILYMYNVMNALPNTGLTAVLCFLHGG